MLTRILLARIYLLKASERTTMSASVLLRYIPYGLLYWVELAFASQSAVFAGFADINARGHLQTDQS